MTCKHYTRQLNESDRYFINAPQYDNCVFCLINDQGALTQEQIANYFGLSKMRINQIQKLALKRFNKKMKEHVK